MMWALAILNLDKVPQHFLVEKRKGLNSQVNSKRNQQEKQFIFLMNQQQGYTVMMFLNLLMFYNELLIKGIPLLLLNINLDVIKVADHIIDLGPEGGAGGGTVVVTGTPEKVAKCEKSYTGQFLKTML